MYGQWCGWEVVKKLIETGQRRLTAYTQRIRSQSVKPHGRRARPAEPRRNFGCGFYGETGTNFEACKLNFGAAQVVM